MNVSSRAFVTWQRIGSVCEMLGSIKLLRLSLWPEELAGTDEMRLEVVLRMLRSIHYNARMNALKEVLVFLAIAWYFVKDWTPFVTCIVNGNLGSFTVLFVRLRVCLMRQTVRKCQGRQFAVTSLWTGYWRKKFFQLPWKVKDLKDNYLICDEILVES